MADYSVKGDELMVRLTANEWNQALQSGIFSLILLMQFSIITVTEA